MNMTHSQLVLLWTGHKTRCTGLTFWLKKIEVYDEATGQSSLVLSTAPLRPLTLKVDPLNGYVAMIMTVL